MRTIARVFVFTMLFLAVFFKAGATIYPKVAVLCGETYYDCSGKKFFVWKLGDRKFINKVNPWTGKMQKYYIQ
jgi:hypothetical protein